MKMKIKLKEYDAVLLENRATNAGLTSEEYMIFCLNVALSITTDDLKDKLKAFKKAYRL